MNYKLIAVDLDDTLLNEDLTVSEDNKNAIAEAIARGKMVVISTGRMYKSALPFALETGVTLPLITYQGALVKDSRKGKVLFKRFVPRELAREVLDLGYEAGVHINLYYDDELYVDSITEEGIGYAKLARVELKAVGDLREFIKGDPIKILFVAEPGDLDNLLRETRHRFGQKLHITKSKPNYLEFMHPEANKGRALEELGRFFDVSKEEMIAVGDSFNDLEMIKYAGLGVAMGNAHEEVKRSAQYVTLDNKSSGVAHVINKFMLSNNCKDCNNRLK